MGDTDFSELALILSTFSPKKELRDSKPHTVLLTCYRRAQYVAGLTKKSRRSPRTEGVYGILTRIV